MYSLANLRDWACFQDEDTEPRPISNISNHSVIEQGHTFSHEYDNCTSTDCSNNTAEATVYEYEKNMFTQIEELLYGKVIVGVCFIGFFGNCLNICMLIGRRTKHLPGRIEKFAYSGLIALAMSDTLFCAMVIPHVFIDQTTFYFEHVTFDLVYSVYNNALINIFIMTSTWLTVTLALGRYMAVCRPMKAREFIGLKFAMKIITFVLCFCLLFNIPRFWLFTIETAPCTDGTVYYFNFYGYMKQHPNVELAYMWTYFVFVILFPLLILVFCNLCLIWALRQSIRTRQELRASTRVETVAGTNNTITLTLIVIIVMYIVLSSPAEIINFVRQRVLIDESVLAAYNLAIAIVNTLQTINFAFNFIPYWIINADIRSMICKVCQRRAHTGPRLRRSAKGHSVLSRFSSFSTGKSDTQTTQLGGMELHPAALLPIDGEE